MRQFRSVILIFLCVLVLTVPVLAQSGAGVIRSEAAITADGRCQVSLTATVTLPQSGGSPVFPVPVQATDITLNGFAASGVPSGQARLLELTTVTGGMAGEFTLNITYNLPQVISTIQVEDEEGSPREQMLLSLPILSGFAYPVQALSFRVTLPGEISARPTFVSGYHQQSIEQVLDVHTAGSVITGTSTESLKDHETLTMTLEVDQTLFPQAAATRRVIDAMDIAVIAAALAAVLYYLLALRPPIPGRFRRTAPPDGICAGDVTGYLTGRGTDLTMLVVTWAQLGYLRIQLDDNGRVLLHKRMDMGNERSPYENRWFKNLFGRRRIVDGTGYHYAELCRQAAKKAPQSKLIYTARSGNPTIFRCLCCLTGILSGISFAGGLFPQPGLPMILLGLLGGGCAWLIQSAGLSLALRNRTPVFLGTVCAALWLILGILSGKLPDGILVVLFQFLCGTAAAYGGRRTELGAQAMSQILCLRRFLRTAPREELRQLIKSNPGYFHTLAPYALALGVDRAFARRFDRLRLQECTYLISGINGQMTAAEWAQRLRTAVNALDAKAKRLPLERLTGR